MHRRGERGERDERRGDVRGLRVVHVEDAVDAVDLLEPVLDAGERREARARIDAAGQRDRGGRGGVGEVVRPAQPDLDPLPLVHERAVADLQRRHPAGRAGHVDRRERDVLGTLTREGLELGVAVGLQRAVAVEVVGLEVQQDRRLGRERQRVLELEGGRLADDGRAVQVLAGQRRVGGPDVADDPDRLPGRPVDRAEQLDGRRLAVRARHRDRLGVDEPPRELELAHDRDAPPPRLGDHRRLRGDAGGLHDRGDPVELRQAVRADHRRDALGHLRRAGVDDEHLLPPRQQRSRGRHARARKPDHEVGAARERRSHVIDAW